jgi:hypothetical protein
MRRLPAIVVGLVLAALASPGFAQGWSGGHGGHGGREDGRGESRGYPRERGGERGGPPEGYRGGGQPAYRGSPMPDRGPPPGPGGGWDGDSLGAGWSAQQDEVRQGVRQRRFVPLGRAIQSIRRHGPGHELDAGLEQWGGRPAYRVRWAAPDGRRIDYMVDAESGAILSADGGR